MAFYSVWDWPRNSWAIYETSAPVSVGDDPVAPRPGSLSPIGADPDRHVKPLPSGARYVRHEHFARGEVRRRSGGWSDVGDDAGSAGGQSSMSPFIAFGLGVAVAAWWLGRRRR